MKLYQKLCRPMLYIPGCQGWSDEYRPLDGWYPEEEEEYLREKYPEDELKKLDDWGSLKFKYKYVEYCDFIKKERVVVK